MCRQDASWLATQNYKYCREALTYGILASLLAWPYVPEYVSHVAGYRVVANATQLMISTSTMAQTSQAYNMMGLTKLDQARLKASNRHGLHEFVAGEKTVHPRRDAACDSGNGVGTYKQGGTRS